MDMEHIQYTRLKAEFIHFKNTLRRIIIRRNDYIIGEHLPSIEMALNKLSLCLKIHCKRNIIAQCTIK